VLLALRFMPTHRHRHHVNHHTHPSKTSSKSSTWIVAILSVIAVLNLSFLGLRSLAAYRAKQRYAQTMGLVVDVTVQRPNDSSVEHHYPVIEFHTSDGKPVIFKSDQGSPEPQYHPGQMVTILYNKEKPYVAIVDTPQ
jgi:hypothetical protein